MFKSVLGWFEESLEGDEIRFKIDIRNQKGGLARERPEEVQRGDGDRWGTVGGVHGLRSGDGRRKRVGGRGSRGRQIPCLRFGRQPISSVQSGCSQCPRKNPAGFLCGGFWQIK